jgi:hypothetical protein
MISNKIQSDYRDAFTRCYPGTSVEFKKAKDDGTWIVIDGDKGPRPLTPSEVNEAIEGFNA